MKLLFFFLSKYREFFSLFSQPKNILLYSYFENIPQIKLSPGRNAVFRIMYIYIYYINNYQELCRIIYSQQNYVILYNLLRSALYAILKYTYRCRRCTVQQVDDLYCYNTLYTTRTQFFFFFKCSVFDYSRIRCVL